MNLTWDSNEIDTDAVAPASAAAPGFIVFTVDSRDASAEAAATASVSISFESHVKFTSISFRFGLNIC